MEPRPSTRPSRLSAAATRVDGQVLVAGGVVDTSNTPTNAAALYDPSTNTWSALPPLAAAREAHAVVRIPGARTLVAGGIHAAGVEMFGAPIMEHDERYAYATEWLNVLKLLWTSEEEFDYDGRVATVNVACRSRAKLFPSRFSRMLSRSAHST